MKVIEKILKQYYILKTKDDFKANIYTDMAMSNLFYNPIMELKTNKLRYTVNIFIYFLNPIGIYLAATFCSENSFMGKKLAEPSGNLLAELYGGYFFLQSL